MACHGTPLMFIYHTTKRRGDRNLPTLKCFHNGIILIVICIFLHCAGGVLDISANPYFSQP